MGFMVSFHTSSLVSKVADPDNDTDLKTLIAGGFVPSPAGLVFIPTNRALFYRPWEADITAFAFERIYRAPSGTVDIAMNLSRAGHTATELPDGSILMAGGITGETTLSVTPTAEVFNPAHQVLRAE